LGLLLGRQLLRELLLLPSELLLLACQLFLLILELRSGVRLLLGSLLPSHRPAGGGAGRGSRDGPDGGCA
jgi:hypothetical protein